MYRERGDGGGIGVKGGGWVLSNRSVSDVLSMPGQTLNTIYQPTPQNVSNNSIQINKPWTTEKTVVPICFCLFHSLSTSNFRAEMHYSSYIMTSSPTGRRPSPTGTRRASCSWRSAAGSGWSTRRPATPRHPTRRTPTLRRVSATARPSCASASRPLRQII